MVDPPNASRPPQTASYLGSRQRRPRQSLILTVESCTAPSVVNATTIAIMRAAGANYSAAAPPPGALAQFNATMRFMTDVVVGLGQREGSPLSLWDAVTAVILLGAQWKEGAAPGGAARLVCALRLRAPSVRPARRPTRARRSPRAPPSAQPHPFPPPPPRTPRPPCSQACRLTRRWPPTSL